MKRWLCTVGCVLVMGLATHAAEGRIPIFEPLFIDGSAGQSISGRYVLTQDIIGTSPNQPAIKVLGDGSQQVDIDLNGFTVTALEDSQEAVEVDTVAAFRLHNGAVVSSSTLPFNAIRVGTSNGQKISSVTMERLTIVGGGQSGMSLNKIENLRITHNTILRSGGHGIRVAGDTMLNDTDATIENNLIRGCAGHGMFVTNGVSSVVIRDNQVESTGLNGIHAGSTGAVRVEGNTVEGSGNNGLFLNKTQACRVSANVVHGSAVDGIQISSNAFGCVVSDNSVSRNQNDGIRVQGDRNQILNNVATDNTGYGILLHSAAQGNTLGRNMARGNGGSGTGCTKRCPGLAPPDFCDQGSLRRKNTSFGDNFAPGGNPGSKDGDGPC